MKQNEQFHFEFSKSPRKSHSTLSDSANSIAVYTVFCVLRKMSRQLGLEAMLEYAGKLMEMIERHEPMLKDSVGSVLTELNVEEMYKEAVRPR